MCFILVSSRDWNKAVWKLVSNQHMTLTYFSQFSDHRLCYTYVPQRLAWRCAEAWSSFSDHLLCYTYVPQRLAWRCAEAWSPAYDFDLLFRIQWHSCVLYPFSSKTRLKLCGKLKSNLHMTLTYLLQFSDHNYSCGIMQLSHHCPVTEIRLNW